MAEVLVHTRDDEVQEYSADEIEVTDRYCRTTTRELGSASFVTSLTIGGTTSGTE